MKAVLDEDQDMAGPVIADPRAMSASRRVIWLKPRRRALPRRTVRLDANSEESAPSEDPDSMEKIAAADEAAAGADAAPVR